MHDIWFSLITMEQMTQISERKDVVSWKKGLFEEILHTVTIQFNYVMNEMQYSTDGRK